ncbi:MAG: c-type cytochrome [Verrucomicrobia bacterium]|nr:c-type cytochrome [Verrucomicrobiota bacterium]
MRALAQTMQGNRQSFESEKVHCLIGIKAGGLLRRYLPPLMRIDTLLVCLAVSGVSATAAAAQGNRSPAPANGADLNPTLRSGQAVYDQHCAACHNANGDGHGPAAAWLFPKPRNFSAGLFKIQSTPAGSLPSDEDLYESITRGLGGSSMPGFTYLSEKERRDVVQYVKHLTAEIGPDGKRINKFEQAKAQDQIAPSIPVPPEPPLTLDSITRGQEFFTRLQCAACHGETGAGDGPSAPTLKDREGIPVIPRDFNTGAFRGGAAGRDLYLRIAVGLAGTPMLGFPDDVLKPDERWDLVHYVQSLRRKDMEVNDILAPENGLIKVSKSRKALPLDPTHPDWERVEAARVPLNPLWPEPDPIPAVAVRTLHDGKQIAILLQWRDAIANGAPVRVQDFQDAAALQFSLNGTTPFLGMGDPKNPVNVWQWKAGWQAEIDGQREDVHTEYASMHVDVYPETTALYRTAEAAGNLLARIHSSPIEDATAWGFGTMKSQSLKGQNVRGKGVWRDGFWNVLCVRELKSKEAEDVKFTPGKPVPVAFAIWNGQQRDRNGRKVISNWFQLVLE